MNTAVRRTGRTAAFGLVFLVLAAPLSVGNAALAIAAALLTAALAPKPGPAPGPDPWRRLAALPGIAGSMARDGVRGSWTVARAIFARERLHTGMVAVDRADRTAAGVAVSGVALTLTPGSILVEDIPDRNVLLFHVLDDGDRIRTRARLEQFYTRHQRRLVR